MKKKEQSSFTSTLSLDIDSGSFASTSGGMLSTLASASYDKSQYVISALSSKYFINSYISISKNIPEIDLYDAIYSKAYDELGLDQAIAYEIRFIEIFDRLDESNRNFYLFIVDPEDIKEIYTPLISEIKYIDTIVPQSLLYKSLYNLDVISSRGIECFIYFQRDDATITIYKDTDLIYTKSINFSLTEMYENFCETYGESISYEEFTSFLINENLKTTQSPFKLDMLKVYKDLFSNINDILAYAKRALDIEKINYLYIDANIPFASKLNEIAEIELGVKASAFDFNYGFSGSTSYITPVHHMLHLWGVSQKHREDLNFSIFHRPPKFRQRSSGKAILLVAASLIIALLYPVLYFSLNYAQTMHLAMLENEYSDVHSSKIARESILKVKEDELKQTNELLAAQQHEYSQKQGTLLKIKEVKVNYPNKSTLLSTLTQDLNKFNIKVEAISYTQEEQDTTKWSKDFELDLVSSSDKKITSLIEHLTKTYEDRFSFLAESIKFDEESKLYFSQLKVSML